MSGSFVAGGTRAHPNADVGSAVKDSHACVWAQLAAHRVSGRAPAMKQKEYFQRQFDAFASAAQTQVVVVTDVAFVMKMFTVILSGLLPTMVERTI